jgi:hypothetical protein
MAAALAATALTRRSNNKVFTAAQYVCFWHKADMATVPSDICFRG